MELSPHPCALMKRSRLNNTAQAPDAEDLSFPPPYSEQAKFLLLADKFLSLDSSKDFKLAKKGEGKSAA